MVSGWLIALLGDTSFGIATGPEADFNVEFTTGEGVKIEVVVPPPWHEDEKALSGLFAAGLIENLSMALEDSGESAEGEADQQIWRTVELLASQATDLANQAKDVASQAKNGQQARMPSRRAPRSTDDRVHTRRSALPSLPTDSIPAVADLEPVATFSIASLVWETMIPAEGSGGHRQPACASSEAISSEKMSPITWMIAGGA